MWLVANELEDPFGMEPNDIAMMDFHHEFCGLLKQLLDSPWMEEDEWCVKEGPWLPYDKAPKKKPPGPQKVEIVGGELPAAATSGKTTVPIAPADIEVQNPPGAAPAAGKSPKLKLAGTAIVNASQWQKVREAVLTEKAANAPNAAAAIALQTFSQRSKQHRLRTTFGLSSRAERDEIAHQKYVKKMKNELFVISAAPTPPGEPTGGA